MAITKTVGSRLPGDCGRLIIFSQASASGVAQTCSTDGLDPYKVIFVTTMYADAASTVTVKFTLNSGIDAAYDTLLASAACVAGAYTWLPSIPIALNKGDALDVLAPIEAAVVSQVAIYCIGPG